MAGTVSSVRLDVVVALCSRVSRTKAAGLIAGEKVFINGQAALSPSRQIGARRDPVHPRRGKIPLFKEWRTDEKGTDLRHIS